MVIECNNAEVRIEAHHVLPYVKLRLPPEYAMQAMDLYNKLKAKRITQVYVKLGLPRKPRTTGEKSQNRHLNGHVQQIAQYTGDSFDDVKMHIKREAVSMGYPFHTDSFGNMVPNSEADASTVECSYLIDTAHRIASDMSLKLKEM